MMRTPSCSVEILEARIAPATLAHPLPDVTAGMGETGLVLDLGNMFDPSPSANYRTKVEFATNYDVDAETPGIQGGTIVLELFDEAAPLTVKNFLGYVRSAQANGDYDGTLFHRSESGFVLQGGGFDITSLGRHIDVRGTVHNEFSADRSNTVGTIAMAKSALGPNSATSEFFFNLADNSGNLDLQNGGFTVFGRVVAGWDVVSAIASSPTANLIRAFQNGSLGTVPTQGGYVPGSGVIPVVDQLIRIVDARIVAPYDGVSPGVTFSASVADLFGDKTSLVSAKVAGDALNLKYLSSGSGVAKVTITARDSGGEVIGTDDFTVKVQPNLNASLLSTTLPESAVPGDKATAKVAISNSAAGTAKGQVAVQVYLSKVTQADPDAVLLDDIGGADILIGQTLRTVSIGSGKSVTVNTPVQIPMELLPSQGDDYRMVAVVFSPDGSKQIVELNNFSDDNTTLADGGGHLLYNAFGTFGQGENVRVNVPLRYVDASGDLVTVTLKGGGFGQLFVDAEGDIDLDTGNTTVKSSLAFAVKGGGRTVLDDVSFSGGSPLARANLAAVNLTGDLIASGGVKSLTLGHMASEDGTSRQIDIRAWSADPLVGATLRLGAVWDCNLKSAMPVASLAVLDWAQTTGTAVEELRFASLVSLSSKGNLLADVTVLGDSTVKSFTVAGVLGGSDVRVAGNVGAVSLGGMISSSFYAGELGGGRVTALSDFDSARTISSFKIKGLATQQFAMENSEVGATSIGLLAIKSVNPVNPGGSYGAVADVISSYQRETLRLTRLSSAGQPDARGDYLLRILDPVA